MYQTPNILEVGDTFLIKGQVISLDPRNSTVAVILSDVDPTEITYVGLAPFETIVSIPWRCCTPPESEIGQTVTFRATLTHKVHRRHGYNCTMNVVDEKYPDCVTAFHTRHTTLLPINEPKLPFDDPTLSPSVTTKIAPSDEEPSTPSFDTEPPQSDLVLTPEPLPPLDEPIPPPLNEPTPPTQDTVPTE